MTVYLPSRDEKDLAKVILSVHELGSGRSNAVGSVTLATGAATTVVATDNCASGSTPILIPMTSAAAAEVGNGTLFISSVNDKSFTISHANSATVGRTFRYAILG